MTKPGDSIQRERGTLQSLQAGRAIAALLVCAFHLSMMFKASQGDSTGTLYTFTWWGFRGVDFFFILSGFIILFAHQSDIGRGNGLGRYLSKRLIRIYPIYWFYSGFVIILSAIGSGVMLAGLDRPDALLTTILLVHVGYADPPLAVSWTLFHEITFYLLFSTFILNRRLGIIVFTVWMVAILALRIWPTPHTFAGTLFSPYNLNFFFGMLAYALHRVASAFLARIMVIIGAGAATFLIFADAKTGGSLLTHVGFGLSFASLIAGCAALERNGRKWPIGPLALIGDASYSLYLSHTTMQIYILKALTHWGFLNRIPLWIEYFIILIGVVASGVLIYLLVERPLSWIARYLLLAVGWSPRASTVDEPLGTASDNNALPSRIL